MYQTTKPRGQYSVTIIGAGIAGAWQALLFAQAGHDVSLHERSDAEITEATSHWAGCMLAPWCEEETSKALIGRLGGIVIDCRGLSAGDAEPELRGVKGEMIVVETDEVDLQRPVRLIHPRW